jgi:hypothetical protein
MLQCYKNKKYNNINSLSAIFCNIDNVTAMLQCYNVPIVIIYWARVTFFDFMFKSSLRYIFI